MKTNLNECLELIEKYKSITQEQIDEVSKDILTLNSKPIMNEITGFNSGRCVPCAKIEIFCETCYLYIRKNECYNQRTFKAIKNSTRSTLLRAIKARVKYLEKHIKP